MKTDLLTANPFIPVDTTAEISFKLFIDFLSERMRAEKGERRFFYRYVLKKFQEYPELYGNIKITEIGKYEEALQLLAHSITPMLEDENETLWAFGKTLSPNVFYGSDAFYKLLEQINLLRQNGGEDKEESMRFNKELQYSFILEKLFDIKTFLNKEWIHQTINPVTGLYQYYGMRIDRRFAWVEPKTGLPEFDCNILERCNTNDQLLDVLQTQLPTNLFEGKGFTIIYLTDITAKQVEEQLSKLNITKDEGKVVNTLEHVNRLLQTIVGSNSFRFGILPFLAINQRAAVLYENFMSSIIADASSVNGVPKQLFTAFVKELQHHPVIRTYREGGNNSSFPNDVQAAFKQAGIKFYMLFPAYYDGQLTGILEVCSTDVDKVLSEEQLALLLPMMHHVGLLLQKIINKFDLRIENIVKDKFTNIQPSVQWKFNEVAWHYLRNNFLSRKSEKIEEVSFTDIYPLYGAVDIRNSTLERNTALKEDIRTRLLLLIETLTGIDGSAGIPQIALIIEDCKKWLRRCNESFNVEEEGLFNSFLIADVYPLLEILSQTSEAAAEKIQFFYAAINEQTGIAFENRRRLETSIHLVNDTINHYFDEAKESLQHIYPCYFDKFRTDGVEYDIYVGQSIDPKKVFTKELLHRFRLWQVQSMADIARLTNSLIGQMPNDLQTTQMLFVHSKTIDISFRSDERRFDVEGAYNIRYQVIKKRIDKVNIRNTTQRLTQPGKIAIVYFNREDAAEYAGYIQQLQEQHILLNDLEYLDLEDLQGVTGLHALRVGIAL